MKKFKQTRIKYVYECGHVSEKYHSWRGSRKWADKTKICPVCKEGRMKNKRFKCRTCKEWFDGHKAGVRHYCDKCRRDNYYKRPLRVIKAEPAPIEPSPVIVLDMDHVLNAAALPPGALVPGAVIETPDPTVEGRAILARIASISPLLGRLHRHRRSFK